MWMHIRKLSVNSEVKGFHEILGKLQYCRIPRTSRWLTGLLTRTTYAGFVVYRCKYYDNVKQHFIILLLSILNRTYFE